jgi:putative drug exporter of the RND superfamily
MIGFSRWCIRHRRMVVAGWVVLAVVATVVAGVIGRNYATDFSLPGTDSQHATNLLTSEFTAQSGDSDQIVFRYTRSAGIDTPVVKSTMTSLLAKVSTMPDVIHVVSPYTAAGAYQIAKDRRTAFATILYAKRANLLPDKTGKPVITAVDAVHVAGLQVAAGGQVIEQAEGFSIGPATFVGVIAAFLILTIAFRSLLAAVLPLGTAGLGLITGIALIGMATHITDMSNVAPELAVMIGLGVGVDYALFIVTRFRENYVRLGDVHESVVAAMDTSGRAILLAGSTVIIALLGMFATGVSFMYGLAIASILAVLLVLAASLTVLPALLSKVGHRLVGPSRMHIGRRRKAGADAGTDAAANGAAPVAATAAISGGEGSGWRRWSLRVQRQPVPLAVVSLLVMAVFLIPFFSMRLESTDAGNDPSGTNTQRAFNLVAEGFGPGFNGPLVIAVELNGAQSAAALPQVRAALANTTDVGAVTAPTVSPSGKVAVLTAYPDSAPQASATVNLVNRIRTEVAPKLERSAAAHSPIRILVGGFTAGSIDFSHVMAAKLPLFIALVVVLSALLLFVIFRSLVIPIQAAVMNLLTIGAALGATVAIFQNGWLGGLLGVSPGPIEPWIPVIMFAVVFGLSMDYEVFLVSRIREEWVNGRDASTAVADGIAFTGRVITAAAAIMVCVFLSFMLGDERAIKEFGFGLAAAVFLDALVIRCVMLPAVLQMLGEETWKLPKFLDQHLPHINIEGSPTALDGAAQERASEPAGV